MRSTARSSSRCFSLWCFEDKIKYYKGFTNDKGQVKDGTKIIELVNLANSKSDYTESDINNRDEAIIDTFIEFLKKNNLTK